MAWVECPDCKNHRYRHPRYPTLPCPRCDGTGEIWVEIEEEKEANRRLPDHVSIRSPVKC